MPLFWVDGSGVAAGVRQAEQLLTVAAAADGFPAVSDQALVAAGQGARELRLWFTAPPAGGTSPAAWDDAVWDAVSPVAVSVLGEGELDIVVSPAARGRGFGAEIFGLLRGATAPAVKTWVHGENPAARRILTACGARPVRQLLQMRLSPQLLPAIGESAAGRDAAELQIREFVAGSAADAAAWVRVNAAAFAAHPEQGRISLADFGELCASEWFNPADLLFACADGEVIGFAWVKTLREATGTHCELYAIGVLPERAGGGIGGRLLRAALVRMAVHNPAVVSLYVDGDNPAKRLYERFGFTVFQESWQWEIPAVS